MKTNYRHEEIYFNRLKEQIKLPKFQRSLVWSADKKKKFINTILSGDPCGTMLLFQNDDGTYTLVDGLQRFSTLIDFSKNPSKYFDLKVQYANQLDEILKYITGVKGDISTLRNTLIKCIEKSFVLDGRSSYQMMNETIKNISIFQEQEKTKEFLCDFFESLKKDFDISDLLIHAMIYTGDYNNLPDIFSNMNSNGTTLSKYDVYAALWSDKAFRIFDEKLLNAVEDKYNDMMNNTEIEIESYEMGSILNDKTLNLYEICVAVGRVLRTEFPVLFPSPKQNQSASTSDSLGFNLLSSILIGDPQKKKNLPSVFENATGEDVCELMNQIICCAKILFRLLGNYAETFYGASVYKYIESQTVCMLTTIFRIYYKEKARNVFTPVTPEKKIIEKLNRNLPKRYLYDIITNYWGSTGDKKVANELQKETENNRFLSPITLQSWEINLNEWLKLQEDSTCKSIPIENKLIINYILSMSGDMFDDEIKKWDINCIIPKEEIYKKFKGAKGKYSVMNLSLIPVIKETKSKINDGQTLYELEWNGKGDFVSLKHYLYPAYEDISFAILNDDIENSDWKRYLKNRRNFIVDTFCGLIKNS